VKVKTTPWSEGPLDALICTVGETPAGTEQRLGRPLANKMAAGGVYNWAISEAFSLPPREVEEFRREKLLTLNLFPYPLAKTREQAQQWGTGWKDAATKPSYYNPAGQKVWEGYKGELTDAGWEDAQEALQLLSQWSGPILLPMGNLALAALTGLSGITKHSGSPYPKQWFDQLPTTSADVTVVRSSLKRRHPLPPTCQWVIPTLHPATALDREGGNWHNRLHLRLALQKAKRFSEGAQLPKKTFHLSPTFSHTMEFLNHCHGAPIVNTDVEVSVSRRSITCFSLARSTTEAMCIPLLDEHWQPFFSAAEELEIVKKMASIVSCESTILCNQNLPFDLWIYFNEWGLTPAAPYFDTMCAFSILNPGLKKDLGTINAFQTDMPYYKDDGKAWIEEKQMKDIVAFWRYSAADSTQALEAAIGNSWNDGLLLQLEKEGFATTMELTMNPVELVLDMMVRGIKVDIEQLDKLQGIYQGEINETLEALAEIVGFPLNPNSPKQCQKYFYEDLGLAPYVNRKTGKPTLDKKALVRLARKHESRAAAQTILSIRRKKKLKSTYFDVSLSSDGRLRSSINLRGTGFGRLSMSSTIYGEGLNMQNQPPTMRSMYVAD